MEVYGRGDVAFILGMPDAKVKNWTIGRPLTLAASVRAAKGTGSRNLYDIEDVYAMGLANALAIAGLDLELVGVVVKKIRDGLHSFVTRRSTNVEPSLNYIGEMIVELSRDEITITLTGTRFKSPGFVLKEVHNGSPFVKVRYSVSVDLMVSAIEQSILNLRGEPDER